MEKIQGELLKGMLISGSNHLNQLKKDVDAMNVFPVPDGDTGTNMSLTFSNGVSEVIKSGSNQLDVIAKTFSRGLLMGARGNSGVILSQIFRGFYQHIKELEEVNVAEFAKALNNGSKMAYKAVMRPTEGTILTVTRLSSEAGLAYMEQNPQATLEQLLECVFQAANTALQDTPNLLPVLKEAGCVDSGGYGYTVILEGFLRHVQGHPVEDVTLVQKEEVHEQQSGYRVEFILKYSKQGKLSFKEDRIRKQLEALGNAIQLHLFDEELQLSIHTMSPGEILMIGGRFGEFTKVQIEPMGQELQPSIIQVQPMQEEAEYGRIAVGVGAGVVSLLKELGFDQVVEGGQTMNPSTEDFVSAIGKVHAKTIYLFPNNSNIIMAAKQASQVIENKQVIVIETKSIPQCFTSALSFDPEASVQDNTEMMNQALTTVTTGSVTYAIKDTTSNGQQIHQGDFMSILEKDIIATSNNAFDALKTLVANMVHDDAAILTILCGQDVDETQRQQVESYFNEVYDLDIVVQDGGQPVYHYIVGLE